MTSSSSLYGNVNQQNTQSTNSTSLYGGADTPIPTPEGDLVVRGDLIVLSGNILTTATTGNIFPANATTINLGNAATTINIGADTGTTTINNNLVVDGSVTAEGADFGNITIGVDDDNTITTTSGELRVSSATGIVKLAGVTSLYTDTTGSFNLLNTPATVNAFQNATALTIGDATGTTTIRNDLVVQGGVTAGGADFGNIQIAIADDQTISTTAGALKLSPSSGNVGLIGVDTLYTDNTGTFNLLNSPTTIYAFDEATTLEIGASSGVGTTVVRNSFAVDGTQVGLAQATSILYSEANDRLNRPAVRSTTGNTSGWRVEAPNATTSAIANISAFSSNDNDNGKFISIQARGATSNDLRIQTGKYTAGVLGGSGTVVSFIDNVTTYATVNPSGPTNPLDLTTKAYVDALPANITYTIDATAVTGGANLNLVGSDATTDSVKFAGGTNVTVTRTDANTITISAPDTNTTYTQNASTTTGGANLNLVGSDATTDTIKFAQGTGISVSRTDANTITITNTAPDVNTTYTQNFSSTTGGTNLNLVGSDSTTDTVKFADGTGVTVSYTDANTATVAIGQAVGTSDNVQFNGVTTNSLTTGTVNANGGVSFVNTAPMGGTYATINPFGPFNTDDLTTVGYVNSVLPTVVTYTQDASATTGGANLNLVGSDATTDTVKFSGGGATTVSQTSANEITISSTDTNTTYTQDASATTGGANVNLVGSDSTTDTIKYAGAGSVSVVATDANTVTITGTDTNTTYTIDASATTGGANLNLVGSDATTDTVKIASGTGVTVAQTSANELSVAIGQSVATTADVTFNTVNANLTDDNYVLGQLYATRNTAWTPPPSTLTTITGLNGFAVGSSTGYAPNIQAVYYSGDTTSGVNSAASFVGRGATGTSTSPGAASANQVMGTFNWDGYGTTSWASSISTTNQGAGTTSLVPMQMQAYARQAFADSAAVSTTVTGASGTGSVATLTFTTQNTAPYVVGQTVTVAGMTPSGYNGTVVITAATTSSISYANTTTGFTTGGTITAARTVTQAGMGFRVRGFANSTNMTAANRFNFMDLTASAATFKSNAYTFANEVITGSTLTATNYLQLTSTAHTIGNIDGPLTAVRTSGAIAGARPVFFLRNTTTTSTTPATGDGASFRQQAAGSNGTVYQLTQISGNYSSTGDTGITFDIANGDQTGATMTVVRPFETKLSSTVIRATATPSATAGANTLSTVAVFEASKITASVPVKFPVYTAAAANAITGEVGMQICISNSASGGNPNGMMAFWDTTNARWSYIHDNSAV